MYTTFVHSYQCTKHLFTQLGKAKKLKMTPMPMKRMAPSGHLKKFMAVVS